MFRLRRLTSTRRAAAKSYLVFTSSKLWPFSVRIFPESLRWLLATQQYGRSKWIMGRIAEKNQVNVELDADNILTGKRQVLMFCFSF